MLKENPIILRLMKLYYDSNDSLMFHKQSYKELKKLCSIEIISEVFERCITDDLFINKKWTSLEIPHLPIFTNDDMDIKYNIFSPSSSKNLELASYLIHHHMDFTLSSYVFFGKGYQTIQFDKNIIKNSDGTCQLDIIKDFFHEIRSVNTLESWYPHVLFNVTTTTATLALWTCKKKLLQDINNRENYYFEKGSYHMINDHDLSIEAKKIDTYCNDSELHIHAICYLMQEIGYKNKLFLKRLLQSSLLTVKWEKWLSLLFSDKLISPPFYDNEINTLKKQIKIADIRKFDQIKNR